jgi:hypothetical protein
LNRGALTGVQLIPEALGRVARRRGIVFLHGGTFMYNASHDDSDNHYAEESLREIIRYAVGLQDQRSNLYSEGQIRSILAQLDIPPNISDQALRHAALSRHRRNTFAPWRSVFDSFLLGAGIALGSAIALPFIPGAVVLLPVMFGVGLMFSGILAARSAMISPRRFQMANFALWAGMGGAYVLATAVTKPLLAVAWPTLIPWAFPAFWAFSSVAGAILTRYEGSGGQSFRTSRLGRTVGSSKAAFVRWVKQLANSLHALATSVVTRLRIRSARFGRNAA